VGGPSTSPPPACRDTICYSPRSGIAAPVLLCSGVQTGVCIGVPVAIGSVTGKLSDRLARIFAKAAGYGDNVEAFKLEYGGTGGQDLALDANGVLKVVSAEQARKLSGEELTKVGTNTEFRWTGGYVVTDLSLLSESPGGLDTGEENEPAPGGGYGVGEIEKLE
jgi:hypothetical protein